MCCSLEGYLKKKSLYSIAQVRETQWISISLKMWDWWKNLRMDYQLSEGKIVWFSWISRAAVKGSGLYMFWMASYKTSVQFDLIEIWVVWFKLGHSMGTLFIYIIGNRDWLCDFYSTMFFLVVFSLAYSFYCSDYKCAIKVFE